VICTHSTAYDGQRLTPTQLSRAGCLRQTTAVSCMRRFTVRIHWARSFAGTAHATGSPAMHLRCRNSGRVSSKPGGNGLAAVIAVARSPGSECIVCWGGIRFRRRSSSTRSTVEQRRFEMRSRVRQLREHGSTGGLGGQTPRPTQRFTPYRITMLVARTAGLQF
jgi:hypothetical protein